MTHFFSKRIGKEADSITHYHLMTALSKTPSCCPMRLGAGCPPQGWLAWTPSHLTSHSESPAFPQVQAGCSHQAGGLPYLGHPPGSKVPAGWAVALRHAWPKLGRREGRLGLVSPRQLFSSSWALPHVACLLQPQPANERARWRGGEFAERGC